MNSYGDSSITVACFLPSNSSYFVYRRSEKSDTGCYLCEVNTEPKSTVYAVYLNVIGEQSFILFLLPSS